MFKSLTLASLIIALSYCHDGVVAQAQPLAHQCKLGATIKVPEDASTIQAAINIAKDGDTVLISPGDYQENLLLENKNLTIASLYLTTGSTSHISNTRIEALPPLEWVSAPND